MRKITEERFCEVSSKFKKVSFNKLSGKVLCEKHREQLEDLGNLKILIQEEYLMIMKLD